MDVVGNCFGGFVNVLEKKKKDKWVCVGLGGVVLEIKMELKRKGIRERRDEGGYKGGGGKCMGAFR